MTVYHRPPTRYDWPKVLALITIAVLLAAFWFWVITEMPW